uniref:Uncharacterized protein n=1 Tax=Arundo donax TaxID=35708 RepID=A0A0A9DU97_ARUDO
MNVVVMALEQEASPGDQVPALLRRWHELCLPFKLQVLDAPPYNLLLHERTKNMRMMSISTCRIVGCYMLKESQATSMLCVLTTS